MILYKTLLPEVQVEPLETDMNRVQDTEDEFSRVVLNYSASFSTSVTDTEGRSDIT